MPQDLLWFLLPVAAASGWWLAARKSPDPGRRQGGAIPADYYKGINYFLNQQPDKAIDVFIEMLSLDSDSVEPHIALGNLFRRRGETDRAIRIHQNLIARPSLTQEQRRQALIELGHDYMQAGLFDRAESLLEELVSLESSNIPALQLLLEIYEQEAEWPNAIMTAGRIESRSKQSLRQRVALYYGEMAEEAIKAGEYDEARKSIRHALSAQSNNVRALLLQARMDEGIHHHRGVIKACKRILQQDLEYLGDCMTLMMTAYQAISKRREFEGYIEGIITKQNAIHPVLVYCDYLIETTGQDAAINFLMDYLEQQPSLPGLQRLLYLQQRSASSELDHESRVSQSSLNIIARLLENTPLYICNNCGFSGVRRHWQCPGCRRWDCMAAVTGDHSKKDTLLRQVKH